MNVFIRKNSKEILNRLKALKFVTYDFEEYKDCPNDWCTVVETDINYAGIWNKPPTDKNFYDCGDDEELFFKIVTQSKLTYLFSF